jgi:type III pantothenate kinase
MSAHLRHYLVLDVGNTRTKWGLVDSFSAETPPNLFRSGVWSDELSAAAALSELGVQPVAWAVVEVGPESRVVAELEIRLGQTPLRCTPFTPSAVKMSYSTPATLGADRYVGAVAAYAQSRPHPVLVVDVGTAITYDYVADGGIYLGGSIAPGLRLRYRALHDYTSRLPLLESSPAVEDISLVGTSTEGSLRSGVELGMAAELAGMIEAYRGLAGPTLAVYLTGGDAHRFEKQLNPPIFVAPHLVLQGAALLLHTSLRA